MWHEGSLKLSKIYHYHVKQYDRGSKFGIDGGRISKMTVTRDGECVCNYDRGWDIEPVDPETLQAANILYTEYN